MGSGPRQAFDNPIVEWIDSRLPVFTMMQKEYGVFPTPKNFNYFWNFGAIAMTMLVIMIVTGITLAMHYTPHATLAFGSVERIMRDVNYGWLIRYLHMNGASFFFIAVYIHIFRGLYYGSYKKPRELLWIFGVVIFILMMATAFMGYVLPWGQMSFWGAQVITNFFSAIPGVGEDIVVWLRGGFSIDNPALNRFFSLHYLLPFVILGVVVLHVWALHVTGSNNPTGIEPKGPQDTVPFSPYYTMKDTFGLLVFLVVYTIFVFYLPNALGHPDNYIPANPMQTPPHIVPEWYFLPFYAILRAITFDLNLVMLGGLGFMFLPFFLRCANGILPFKLPEVRSSLFFVPAGLVIFVAGLVLSGMIPLLTDAVLVEAKLGGVIAMFGALAVLLVLPWLDSHPVRSARYRPLFKLHLLLTVVSFVVLGYVGMKPADALLFGLVPLSWLGLICTAHYFAFFLVIVPWLSQNEQAKPLPASIHEAVLAENKR